MATPSDLRPGVTVEQVIRATPEVSVTPILAPLVMAPCYQIIDALGADGSLTEESAAGPYEQRARYLPKDELPDPRNNMDFLSIDPLTVTALLNFGGQLTALPRGSGGTFGSAFLNTVVELFGSPGFLVTEHTSYNFGSLGTLVLAFDVANPLDTTRDIVITFSGTYTPAALVGRINQVVGREVAKTIQIGSNTHVLISSTRVGAAGSVTIRKGTSGFPVLFGSAPNNVDYRVTGAGFRAVDDLDGDLTSPWIEYTGGEFFVEGVLTAFPEPDENIVVAALTPRDAVSGALGETGFSPVRASLSFTDSAPLPLRAATATRPGDLFYFDGSVGAEVTKVEQFRVRLGRLNTSASTFGSDGVATQRVYSPFEVNLLTHPIPFSPSFAWVQAQGLTSSEVGQPASILGTEVASAALPAIAQSDSPITGYPLNLTGLVLELAVEIDGIAEDSVPLVLSGAPVANISALVSVVSSALGTAGMSEHVVASHKDGRLVLTTTRTGSSQAITVGSGSANDVLNLADNSAARGVDPQFADPAEIEGAAISLPLSWMTSVSLAVEVEDERGEFVAEATGVNLSAPTTMAALVTAISTAFGGGSDGRIFYGGIHIATISTDSPSSAHGTLTLTTVGRGSSATLQAVAEDGSDGFRYLGFFGSFSGSPAEIQSTTLTFPVTANGDFQITRGGADWPDPEVTLALGPQANAPALAAALNALSTVTTSGGSRVLQFIGNPGDSTLIVRTIAGGSSATLAVSSGNAALAGTTVLGFPQTPTQSGTNGDSNNEESGADGLAGTEMLLRLDRNPTDYSISFSSNSLLDALDTINEAVAGDFVVATRSTNQLRLTSPLQGSGSLLWPVSGTALAILGMSGLVAFGSGRPLPDFYVDDVGAAVVGASILRNKLTGNPFAGAAAALHIGYRALRLDVTAVAENANLLAFSSVDDIIAAIGPAVPENPLCLGLVLAKSSAPGATVYGLGIHEVSPAAPMGTMVGWASALGLVEGKEVYTIVPLQSEPAINALLRQHVVTMSAPRYRGERHALLSQEMPTRAFAPALASGTDARTDGIDNLLVVDGTPAADLIAAGVDVTGTIPVSANVYVEVLLPTSGGVVFARYNVQSVSGGAIGLRTAFAPGENSDGFYSTATLSGLSAVLGADWSLHIRGRLLVIPGTSIPDKEAIMQAAAEEASAYRARRCLLSLVGRVQIPVGGVQRSLPGYYANAVLAGLIAVQNPSQPMTGVALPLLSGVTGTDDSFSEAQLDIASDGGRAVLVQRGASVVFRSVWTTKPDTVEERELSITTQLDALAKLFRAGNRSFTEGRVITPDLLDDISNGNQGLCVSVSNNIVRDCQLLSVLQDENARDRILFTVDVQPNFPCNRVRLTLLA
jgi:hypothetical protein